MPENATNNPSKRFDDAVDNFRNTTKWIIGAAGGVAAFIIGTDPLGRLDTLTGHQWWLAVAALFASLLLTLLMLAFAVEVLAPTSGLNFPPLATANKYRRLRYYLDENVLFQYPDNINSIVKLYHEYNFSQRQYNQTPTAEVEQLLADYESKIDDILTVARWRIIGQRFDWLMWYFRFAMLAIAACLFVFITTTKPAKDKPPTQPPISLTLIVNPPAVSISPTPQPPPPSPAQLETAFDCGDQDQPYKVGPFVIGKTDLENGATTVADLVKRLTSGDDRRSLIGLLLLGSADKTPLSPRLAQQYASNSGVAQARAEWVRAQLLESDALHRLQAAPVGKIAALVAGPTQVGVDVDPAKLAIDRAVRVCVLWQQVKK
jgi:hypothetical protein